MKLTHESQKKLSGASTSSEIESLVLYDSIMPRIIKHVEGGIPHPAVKVEAGKLPRSHAAGKRKPKIVTARGKNQLKQTALFDDVVRQRVWESAEHWHSPAGTRFLITDIPSVSWRSFLEKQGSNIYAMHHENKPGYAIGDVWLFNFRENNASLITAYNASVGENIYAYVMKSDRSYHNILGNGRQTNLSNTQDRHAVYARGITEDVFTMMGLYAGPATCYIKGKVPGTKPHKWGVEMCSNVATWIVNGAQCAIHPNLITGDLITHIADDDEEM